jgi:hypothetical protein
LLQRIEPASERGHNAAVIAADVLPWEGLLAYFGFLAVVFVVTVLACRRLLRRREKV